MPALLVSGLSRGNAVMAATPRPAGANPQGPEDSNERKQTMTDEFPTRGHLLAERGELIARINEQTTAIMEMGGQVLTPPRVVALLMIEYEDITGTWPSKERLLEERQDLDAVCERQREAIMSMRAFSKGTP
jgi:hypothetical protein